ncbi:hypothetical protein FE391_11870 [Nonomuraea sp. KC401]|uniref:hypothetical protein n=1 Tax=unclassified Nonomuraea TaxID=2593643 RepID=UPI0010FD3A62|nr:MULTISPECIES: hypothetical protein [unclassified Nonomuraea]NBE94534.1 hypothetical protein [Nonomuraea sp. K271]TLF76386.1 hypothetical protein FE391_11870 [Nonomuraea sp. KC401]
MAVIGAICFGIVIGWLTRTTQRHRPGAAGLSDLSAVLAVVGGGAVTALLGSPEVFGGYAVGLAVGFFGHLALVTLMPGSKWTGDQPGRPTSTYGAQSSGSAEP